MLEFLSSIKNALYFFLLVILFMFLGVLIIPGRMQAYTGILDTVLIKWLMEAGLGISWWILGIIGSLMLVGLSTLVGSLYSLALRYKGKGLSLKTISPHVMHLGVLVMLLGHLMGSLSGIRTEGSIKEGGVFHITDEVGFSVEKIIVEASPGGPPAWEVKGRWVQSNAPAKGDGLRPARPAYYKGLWLFLSSAEGEPLHAVLMGRSDRGGFLLFAGGVAFFVGCAMNLYMKVGMSSPLEGQGAKYQREDG